jgi:hypothetical protein
MARGRPDSGSGRHRPEEQVMAERVLMISWGQPVRGREQHGLEVFGESVAYYEQLRDAGRIEGFEVMILDPNGLMEGCMLLLGSHAQLDAVREEERFRRLMIDASLIVDDLRMAEGYGSDGIQEAMGLYADAVARVPQMA